LRRTKKSRNQSDWKLLIEIKDDNGVPRWLIIRSLFQFGAGLASPFRQRGVVAAVSKALSTLSAILFMAV
jgi:hypothetical protein